MKFVHLYTLRSLFIIFVITQQLNASDVDEFPCFQELLDSGSLHNVAFDETRIVYYVGAVDRIYQLSHDLKILNSLQTGPVCGAGTAGPCENCSSVCPQNEEPVSCVNKLLLVDSAARSLIACCDVCNGSCRSFSLNDVSEMHLMDIPVLPSNAAHPAVGFIGKGQNEASVLYVGNSHLQDGEYFCDVPLISVRNPQSLQLLESIIDLKQDVQNMLSIEFVTSFQHLKYVYFFVRRRSSAELATFLLRICKDQPKRTLVELPLSCNHLGSNFAYLRDAVVASYSSDGSTVNAFYAVFTRDSSSSGADSSVLCVYPIGDVNRVYQTAIQNCFNGNGVRGPNYATRDTRTCIQMNLEIDAEYCGDIESNSPIEGNITIHPSQVFPLPINVATAISSSEVNGLLVLYIGDSGGRLLKATFTSPRNEQLPFDWVATPAKVLQPIKRIVVDSSDNLYLLTDKHLCRVPAYDCSKAHSCDQCLRDPHCGWCMKSLSCAHKSQCPPVNNMDVWLHQLDQCPLVTMIDPVMLSVNLFKETPMVVYVKHIPGHVLSTSCLLKGEHGYVSDAFVANVSLSDQGHWLVSCTPHSSPPQMNGSVSMNLTLVVALSGLQWFRAHVIAFNCSQINTCTESAESSFPCVWCSRNHFCRHRSQLDDCSVANDEEMVNQSSMCPRIQLVNSNRSLLVTGSKHERNFSLSVFNIMPFHRAGELRCRFISARGNFSYTEATVVQVAQVAQVDDNVRHSRRSVECSLSKQLEYLEEVASELFQLDLVWGSNYEYAFDNPFSLKVEVYKCHLKASNCGRCLLLGEEYGCVWCMDRCMHKLDCMYPAFIDHDAMCPNPEIISFSPLGGPVGGQTTLTINGINLGKAASDLTIHVANQPCAILNENYLPSERVLCQTGKAEGSSNGTIILSVRKVINSTESKDVYTYKDPSESSFMPRVGPMSGGTRVTVIGTDLDYGSMLEVVVVGPVEKPVTLLWRNGTHMTFVMPRYDNPNLGSVSLKILVDKTPMPLKPNNYVYSEDPTINMASSGVSLVSGGNMIKFRGTNLFLVAQPQFVVYVGNENFTTNCTSSPNSRSLMSCPTPDLRSVEFRPEDTLEFDYGFVMDDVKQLLRVQKDNPSVKKLEYFRNPYISKFKSPVAYSQNYPLEIYGVNLTVFERFLAAFNILVNGSKCSSPVFTDTKISCTPPDEPKNLTDNGDALVVISLGNFVFEVGYLSYRDDGLSTALIIGIACGIGVPLLIGIILLVVCLCRICRRRSKSPISRRKRNGSHRDGQNNSYSRTEMKPLRDRPNGGDDLAVNDLHNDDGRFIQNLLQRIENPRRRNAAREILVSRERLDVGDVIGRGHFSCVCLASLRDGSMKNPVQVAAKTIEGPVLDEDVLETILRESIVTSNFNHPRLVSLIGLCLSSRANPIVILPFMSNGDLRTYIKDKSRNFTARQLLLMSQQVAEGMSYLSSCDLVHRNLAARNCLLDENLEVKVSDFVLCHELFERGLQCGSPDDWGKLPIKWMAPETLEGFVFTPYSDVWSFGILAWELMTRGITPYSDIPLGEMKSFLDSGKRLKRPKYCPETVYRIMIDCWQAVAERRPTFPDLVNRLEVLLNPPRKRRPTANSVTADEEPLYANTTDPPSSLGDVRRSFASPIA